MGTFLSICGIILAFFMLKYRERLGDMIGDAEWMSKLGGVYNFIIILSLIIFFWSLAELTGTTYIFFAPIKMFFPGAEQTPINAGF